MVVPQVLCAAAEPGAVRSAIAGKRNFQRKRQRHLLRLRAGLAEWGNTCSAAVSSPSAHADGDAKVFFSAGNGNESPSQTALGTASIGAPCSVIPDGIPASEGDASPSQTALGTACTGAISSVIPDGIPANKGDKKPSQTALGNASTGEICSVIPDGILASEGDASPSHTALGTASTGAFCSVIPDGIPSTGVFSSVIPDGIPANGEKTKKKCPWHRKHGRFLFSYSSWCS